MGSSIKNTPGFVSLGGEAPELDPHAIVIVGHDIPDVPELSFARCPRLAEEVAEVAAEVGGTFTPGEDGLSLASIRQHGVIDPAPIYKLKSPLTLPDGRTLPFGTPIALDGRRRILRARIVFDEEKARRVPVAERKGLVRVLPKTGGEEALFQFNRLGNTGKPMRPEHRAELMKTWMALMPGDQLDDKIRVIAESLAVHPRTVKNWLAIDAVVPEAREAIHGVAVDGKQRKLPARLAPVLARLPAAEQRKQVEDWKQAGAPKGNKAESKVRAAGRKQDGARLVPRPGPKLRPPLVIERLHTTIDIAFRGKRGSKAEVEHLGHFRSLLAWAMGDDDAADELPPMLQGWCRQATERPRKTKGTDSFVAYDLSEGHSLRRRPKKGT